MPSKPKNFKQDVTISSIKLSSVELGFFIKFYGLENAVGLPNTKIVKFMITSLIESIKQSETSLTAELLSDPKKFQEIYKKVVGASSQMQEVKTVEIKRNSWDGESKQGYDEEFLEWAKRNGKENELL